MPETAQNIQQVAQEAASMIPVIGGIGCVVFGLFFWLGGLRWSRLIAALVGLVTGGMGIIVSGYGLHGPAVLAMPVGALVGLLANRILLGIMGSLILGSLVMVTVSDKGMPAFNIMFSVEEFRAEDGSFSHESVMAGVRGRVQYYGATLKEYAVGLEGKAITAGVVTAIIALFLRSQILSSVTCASLGTGLIFAGMILVLINKGAAPVERIAERPGLYRLAAGGMLVFGTAVQYALFRGRKADKKVKSNNGDE
ncbi:hypothetical protein STSP2_03218 [Anaerohalosphaera lusitana]|uniref:Uncharacterized protein n=1 Tax=Anaerohalosphaera lusitana TaxID=1936003 RepID=A0A1U9NR67_9BACT|nr:hypothetical protein [Anaerohalosphaera lusitana]AQT70016.1 hypothetical protein STSP2_03218 [Anaerohalosphaera lusitana]